jgi:hypothetical protein
VAARLAARLRFFHWELEFPDVFRAAGAGFDAILGNPPWDIAKPNSKEFFSNLDPLYRTYGKQDALRKQSDYFAQRDTERQWLDYNGDFRAQSNFMKFAASAYGDPDIAEGNDRFGFARGKENDGLHARWRGLRAKTTGYADPAHPFRFQGSADINLYKAFLEAAHALAARTTRWTETTSKTVMTMIKRAVSAAACPAPRCAKPQSASANTMNARHCCISVAGAARRILKRFIAVSAAAPSAKWPSCTRCARTRTIPVI